jgi:hypothetical protein
LQDEIGFVRADCSATLGHTMCGSSSNA